jgi:hypothetical protein
LSDQFQNVSQPPQASATVAQELGAEFNQQVQYFYHLERKYSDAQELITTPRKECEALKEMAK